MTPNQADLRILQTMVDSMVGIEKFSYPARQNNINFSQNKPEGEFAHIRVIEEYQEGIPSQVVHAQDELNTTYRTYSLVKIRARIGVVETTGIPSMKIMGGWTSEAMKALMIESGYGFIKCTPLSSEDAKLEKEWEYRKGFSVEFYVTRVFEETVVNITSMQIAGMFVEGDLTVHLMNININE
jgi:hypothetical protein